MFVVAFATLHRACVVAPTEDDLARFVRCTSEGLVAQEGSEARCVYNPLLPPASLGDLLLPLQGRCPCALLSKRTLAADLVASVAQQHGFKLQIPIRQNGGCARIEGQTGEVEPLKA